MATFVGKLDRASIETLEHRDFRIYQYAGFVMQRAVEQQRRAGGEWANRSVDEAPNIASNPLPESLGLLIGYHPRLPNVIEFEADGEWREEAHRPTRRGWARTQQDFTARLLTAEDKRWLAYTDWEYEDGQFSGIGRRLELHDIKQLLGFGEIALSV